MTEYNGHESWDHWNVALWLFNDEGLYNIIREQIKYCRTVSSCAQDVLYMLTKDLGLTKTPDGAMFTYDTVYAAIEDEHEEWWSDEEE